MNDRIMTDASVPPQAPNGPLPDLTEAAVTAALVRMGVLREGERPRCRPLEGGVSSDIWLVELEDRRLCLKRALPQLKVAQLWQAPVARNGYEWEWFRVVQGICPDLAPPLVGHDPDAGFFVMEYLDPSRYPLWKVQLRDGHADPAFAATVGARLALIHGATAADSELACRFATDEAFYAIRLEPYLIATGRVHRDLATRLEALAHRTAEIRLALVHGDVSPKNILAGPRDPVFLDAECAWYGDPAFDLAFCLNHLLLKCLWTPHAASAFLACFERLAQRYLADVTWEAPDAIEARAAALLPGLLLARVDGKSPVEYVTDDEDKARVRRIGRALLAEPVGHLAAVRQAWASEISQ
jgi:aminoglycoside phosphotransferase (APT) family kinase protein